MPPQPIPKTKLHGEKIFRATCSSCHLLPTPKYYSLDTIVEQIKQHKLVKKISLTDEEEALLISYLRETFDKK